ncbi:hypothetical protein [Legionella sainthelensi]|uniref:hypothetical protein n=1 Tax=Legionella sainthelensi TaxID=28087 RepID=UPI001FD14366|nr:hypothetical protein [Legionella sainthelensi]
MNKNNNSLIFISLNVSAEKEAEFNDFYHHFYIPNLLKVIPEIKFARRYEEHNVDGTLRYYSKRFITIYECATETDTQLALKAIKERPGREQEKMQWQQFQLNDLHNLESACIYTLRYQHPRGIKNEHHFGSRPFFMVSVEVVSDKKDSFNEWYETIYLPKNVADVPTWTSCLRYCSHTREPARYVTIYETQDLCALKQSLELMRAPHRLKENASWKQWDTGNNAAITWEDASSFKPIFRYPD